MNKEELIRLYKIQKLCANEKKGNGTNINGSKRRRKRITNNFR